MKGRIDLEQLKALVREAVSEALQQQRGFIYETVVEALEDLALSRAIQEGDQSDYVPREEIRSILDCSTEAPI